MHVGIIGKGIVGSSLGEALRRRGADVAFHDPPAGIRDPRALGAPFVFVCVPTPCAAGHLDDRALLDAVGSVRGPAVVVVRSTLPPGTTERLQRRFPELRVLYAPEFLTESRALEDELHPARQIVGYTPQSEGNAGAVLDLLPEAPVRVTCPAAVAEVVKLFANAFYAVKVSFANQAHDLCAALGVPYESVRALAEADPMCAPFHLDVHHGGYRGFGGKCLPKDAAHMLSAGLRRGVPLSVLRAAVDYNDELRRPEAAE
jgi:UDPglucose 6-dehydrogenase